MLFTFPLYSFLFLKIKYNLTLLTFRLEYWHRYFLLFFSIFQNSNITKYWYWYFWKTSTPLRGNVNLPLEIRESIEGSWESFDLASHGGTVKTLWNRTRKMVTPKSNMMGLSNVMFLSPLCMVAHLDLQTQSKTKKVRYTNYTIIFFIFYSKKKKKKKPRLN